MEKDMEQWHRETSAVSGEISLALTRKKLPGRDAPERWARRLEALARLMRMRAPKPEQGKLL
jgi:hypothetical protein